MEKDLRSPLAKARDEWFESEEGRRCCDGVTSGKYLRNRLESAFLAGAQAHPTPPPASDDVFYCERCGLRAPECAGVDVCKGCGETMPTNGEDCPCGHGDWQSTCPRCGGDFIPAPDAIGPPRPPASDVAALLAESEREAEVAGSFRDLINRLATALRAAEDARVERERNVKVALDTGAKALERVTADLDRERAARVKAEEIKEEQRRIGVRALQAANDAQSRCNAVVRERDEALAELAGLGPVELEASVGEGWGACAESTFNRLSEKGWKKRRIRVVQEHSNA